MTAILISYQRKKKAKDESLAFCDPDSSLDSEQEPEPEQQLVVLFERTVGGKHRSTQLKED
jgi:hypothetical protein